jgi:hypothetical protein
VKYQWKERECIWWKTSNEMGRIPCSMKLFSFFFLLKKCRIFRIKYKYKNIWKQFRLILLCPMLFIGRLSIIWQHFMQWKLKVISQIFLCLKLVIDALLMKYLRPFQNDAFSVICPLKLPINATPYEHKQRVYALTIHLLQWHIYLRKGRLKEMMECLCVKTKFLL